MNLKIFLIVLFLSFPFVASTNSAQKPLKQKISSPFKAEPLFNQLGDLTLVKIYDQYKWQKKLQRVKQYEKKHPTSPITEIINWKINEASAQLLLKTSNNKLVQLNLSFPFPNAFRLQAQWYQGPDPDFAQTSSKPIMLDSSQIKVVLKSKPFQWQIFDHQGKELLAQAETSGLGFGTGLVRESIKLTQEEIIVGLGEQYGEWNHRGRILIMEQDDAYESITGNTYIPIPFLLSSRGYALLVNSYQRVVFDFGKSMPDYLLFSNPDSNLDYILFFSQDPKEILREYTEFIGRSLLIPRWALEPWISRQTIAGWWLEEVARNEVERMLKEKFPIGVVLYENLLSGGAEGPNLGIDPKNKPNLPKTIDYWHQLGIKVVGWASLGQIEPKPAYLKYYGLDQYPEYLVRNPDGTVYLGGINRNMAYLDLTNPDALEYAWEKIYQPLFLAGPEGKAHFDKPNLDGIKLDFCEFFPDEEVPLLVYNRIPGLRLYHPTFFSEWLYQKINQVRPEGGITWVRGAGLGAQKIGFVWTGDRGRTFKQLKHTHIARLNASASGIALIGTDLGGYTSGGILAEEVYNRAVAIDCFSPAFHDHGRAMPPWEQSERGKEIYRFYARLRYNLIPYIYHLVSEAHFKGYPIMRPMLMECPEDQTCWSIDDQYFLGENLLVAPVLENTRTRRIYLPEGKWIDFWTRKTEQGPKWLKYPVPLNLIPVFVRTDSVIPMQFNSQLELGGEFEQKEKDHLLPGWVVFAQDRLEIDQSFQIDHPAKGSQAHAIIKLEMQGEKIFLEKLSPLPTGLIIYHKKPHQVYFSGEELKEVECQNLFSFSAWCYREKDQAILVRIAQSLGR